MVVFTHRSAGHDSVSGNTSDMWGWATVLFGRSPVHVLCIDALMSLTYTCVYVSGIGHKVRELFRLSSHVRKLVQASTCNSSQGPLCLTVQAFP